MRGRISTFVTSAVRGSNSALGNIFSLKEKFRPIHPPLDFMQSFHSGRRGAPRIALALGIAGPTR
jgi:hypothetical protein